MFKYICVFCLISFGAFASSTIKPCKIIINLNPPKDAATWNFDNSTMDSKFDNHGLPSGSFSAQIDHCKDTDLEIYKSPIDWSNSTWSWFNYNTTIGWTK